MSERCVIAGRALEVARIGRSDAGPTLVFLHEGLGSVSAWRDFPAAVARATSCPALVYSRAGYGRSDPVALPRPLTYMHDEAREVLPELLDATGVDDAVLIGHSDGGSIALMYAASSHGRARVRGLVLEAPHVFCEDRSVEAIARARDEYLHGGLRERLARHHADVDVAFWGWNRAWLDPDFREWNIESFLPEVRAPALVIQSDDDPYGTLRQVDAIEARSGGPVERLVLDRCGHSPHRDRPDEVLAAVARFVRTLSAT
ncbi:MAG: alpha/beta hydrolase [Sandaracinaceae bacterium]|nr:alpha/beta hydrolase [Sandaracinaceae bacterium]